MTQEDADLWRREQTAFMRMVREETDRFSTEHQALFAEMQRETRFLWHAVGLDAAPRYVLPLGIAALLSVVIAAGAGSVVGLALARAIATHCTGTTPF